MGLLSELKRRNVYRMVVLYVLASWLIMQAVEVVMTLASLPEWIGRLTLILLALGFPIALILSWFYELTPEGLSLEKEIKPGESITRKAGRRLDFIVIALLCAALLVFAYDKWWISGTPVTSIAVLPLDDISNDAGQQYLADGMTEVLTAELGQIKNLRVISRTSAMRYKGAGKMLPEIAAELHVDALVEGSVQLDGDKVRFTVQLIDGRTDRHLWARSYHRDLRDILTLQGEIARAIADEIQVALTPETESRFALSRTTDGEALRLWAIGSHYLQGNNANSFNRALQAFIDASNRDPEFARAYAEIAYAYRSLGSWSGSQEMKSTLPLAKLAAEKSIQLDPDLAEAHFALAMIYRDEWKWAAAEREFRKGEALNPSDGLGLVEFANFLTSMGQHDHAIEIATHAVALDPVSPLIYNELAFALFKAGRNDDALDQYKISLQLDPDYPQTHALLAELYAATGEHDKAMQHLEKITEDLESMDSPVLGYLGGMYAKIGRTDDAQEVLTLLRKRTETEYVPAMAFAEIYAGLEDYDEAIRWFEAAYEERSLSLVWYRDGSEFPEKIRNDPRIQAILSGMNFPGAE